MKLTIVGCSGSAPGPGTAASCYLVEADGYRVVLDLGSGGLAELQRFIRADEIDAIFLSHLHPDHCVDMASLGVILRFGAPGSRGAIPVVAPPDAGRHLREVYHPGSPPSTFDGVFDFMVPAEHRLGPFTLRTTAVDHPVPAWAVRLEHDGRSLVYSGDTATCPGLISLARGADVLLCEAAWAGSDAPVPGIHLSGREAGDHAAQAGVGRLLITHVPAWESIEAAVAGARETYPGDVVGVMAGDSWQI